MAKDPLLKIVLSETGKDGTGLSLGRPNATIRRRKDRKIGKKLKKTAEIIFDIIPDKQSKVNALSFLRWVMTSRQI